MQPQAGALRAHRIGGQGASDLFDDIWSRYHERDYMLENPNIK